ncbi:hypothetical protein [Anaerotruncus rubiinfantis]|uniref:hypothetical protein n=1 Tax=Anaerotruncus rubiinfantis TaxID=1720200 RepID=UPI003D79AF44
MSDILQGLLKGLMLWLYGLILDGIQYMASALMQVFNMDLAYFETYAPVTGTIVNIVMASGWALLIGNMAFQAMRSMASGLGFEGEDPKILFARTFVFSFLLVASRQICNIGLTLTGTVMDLVGIPDAITITTPEESHLGAFDSSWLLVIIIGLILIFQVIKFFFEIAERYVVIAVLTIMAPLAFGMGGSKNTEDIFKGWARMFGSMCIMMLMNVVFLKLLLSAMSTIPSGAGILPWLLFVVAIARVARKVDDLVCRIGLNPARTGDPLGRGLPLMLTMTVARNIGKTVAATMGGKGGGNHGQAGPAGAAPRPGPTPTPGPAGSPGGQSPQPQQNSRFSSSTAQTGHSATAQNQGAQSLFRQEKTVQPGSSGEAGQGTRPPDRKNGVITPGKQPEGQTPHPGGASNPNASPPPSRPPLRRLGNAAASATGSASASAQRQSPQDAQRGTALPRDTAHHSEAHRETVAKDTSAARTGPRAAVSTSAPGQNAHLQGGNMPGAKPSASPTRPVSSNMARSAQESSSLNTQRSAAVQTSTGEAGMAPPASRRESNTQAAAAPAQPNPHRNTTQNRPAAASGPQEGSPGTLTSPRRNQPSQEPAQAPGAAPPNSRRNGSLDTAPQSAGERPSPRRNAGPSGAAQQPDIRRPQRPPLHNREGRP